MKRTMKQWEKSDIDLSEFLGNIPCEIDEDLYNYIGGATSPQYCTYNHLQMGEADHDEDGVLFYISASQSNDKYYYLGILPEFVQG